VWRIAGLGTALILAAVAIALLAGGLSWFKALFYIDHMETEDRVERMQVDRVVETLQLAPGSVVADIGAGSGLFTRSLARELASGVVYAVDINPNLLTHIEKDAKQAGLANVKTVLAGERDPRLPEPVDLIFICDVLHLLDEPEQYLRGLHAHLRPGGRVAIISFVRNWPPMSNQFSADELERWMKQAGFAPVERHDFIPDQYLAIFVRS
jgi:cyclopropane fatty-acyl-phospholipid synthase-like methyltransferase